MHISLGVLLSPTVIDAVADYLLIAPPGGSGQTPINRLKILMWLGRTHHHEFGHGYFVLEPVGDPLASLIGPDSQLRSYDVRFS